MKKYIGTKDFYMMVLKVVIPIMVQNGITNFVSLLDNVMVGRVGTEQMSGVAIVNQLMFVFTLAIFGGMSGPGIFTAQYAGQKNTEGVRNTMRFKLMLALVLVIIGISVLYFFDETLIIQFLHENNDGLNLQATLGYAKDYLVVSLIGLIPFTLNQVYAGTLRETGETVVPMIAGIVAVFVNLGLNYILIFGHFGAPVMGVVGAAVATVISRFVELAIVIIWTHRHKERNAFIVGVYRTMKIPGVLCKNIILKGSPLLINEFLWSLGMTMLMQSYSMRGLEVIAAFNISNTINNVFNIVFIAMGSAVAIIVGQQLGAGKMEEAVDTDRKLIAFSVVICILIGAILFFTSPLYPEFYNTTDTVKKLATEIICVAACCMPMYAFLHTTYFTLRSGGKTVITFLFDSVYLWAVSVPMAYVLSRFTDWPILPIYITCQCIDLIKCTVGFILLKKKVWLNNIIKE